MEKARPEGFLENCSLFLLGFIATIGAYQKFASFPHDGIKLVEWYFFISLVLMTLGALFLSWKKFRLDRSVGYFLALFAVCFLFQAKDIDAVSLWLDEDYQIWTSLVQLPVEAGWHQHQPPLHFAILGGWIPLLGSSEFSVRFFTLFFSSLGAAFFGFYLKKFSKSWWILIAFLPLYLCHPYIVRYSYEVRPVGMGMFCAILWLGTLYSFLKGHKESVWSAFPLVISTYFVLVTLGFQGPVLGFCLGFVVLFGTYHRKNKILAALSLLIGLLLFLPIQLAILQNAPPRFSRVGGFSFAEFASRLSWDVFRPFVEMYTLPLLPFFVLFFLLGILIEKDWKWKKSLYRDDHFFWFIGLVSFCLLIPFFSGYMDWPLKEYYFLFLWPVFLFALGSFAGKTLPPKHLAIPSVISLVMFLVLLKIPNPFFDTYSKFLEPRADMRGAIKTSLDLSRDGKKTIVFPICAGGSGEWCPNWIVGREAYLGKSQLAGREIRFPNQEFIDFLKIYLAHPQEDFRIIWLFQEEWSRFRLNQEVLKQEPRMTMLKFMSVTVFVQEGINGDSRLAFLEGLKKFERLSSASGRDAFWIRLQIAFSFYYMGRYSDFEFWRGKLSDRVPSQDGSYWLELVRNLEKSRK